MRLANRRAEALERLVRACEERADAAGREVQLLRGALDALPLAVAVVAPDGSALHGTSLGTDRLGSRQNAALVAATQERALHEAGEREEPFVEVLDLHGPPPRTVRVAAHAVQAEGRRLGTVATVEDLSELRHLEKVRRDFVANLSHELRTPIGAIALLAEALADETDAGSIRHLVERVSVEAERAARIVDGLLDLGRIEAERAPAGRRVELQRVVESALDRVQAVAQHREVPIEVRLQTGLIVPGDEDQLVSAVANLLDNAVKYSEPGSPVVLSSRTAGAWAELAVHDRGIGIPTRDHDRIFERFYRVDPARSRETGGTGLGLAIVRHVALNHGGSVSVESREGEGSTFVLRLPMGGW